MQNIFRKNHKNDAFLIVSYNIIHNDKLSFEARGLISYLLSLPITWNVNVQDLIHRSPDARRKKILRMIDELIKYGYMQRITEKDKNNKIMKVHYKIYEEPIGLK